MTVCWIVTEGLAGTENQCLGVAEALGVMPVVKRIGLLEPWRTLSPWLGFEKQWIFTGDGLEPPWPDLLICSGRKSIAAARYIKHQSHGKTFVALIQDPRIAANAFDLVAVPAHDSLRGNNVVVTQAAPNRITSRILKDARSEFAPLFEKMPAPRVAVLIGGNSKTYTMTAEIIDNLCSSLKKLATVDKMSLMVTVSRRTPMPYKDALTQSLKDTGSYVWDGEGRNPYFGLLAWADDIIVTADSVSMISEAATTGKPVYMVPMKGGSRRFGRFHSGLLARGIIRLFEGSLTPYHYEALNDALLVATEIKKALKNKQS